MTKILIDRAVVEQALAEPAQEPATMPGPGLVMCPACCSQFEPAGAQSRRAGAGACAEISVNRVIAAIEEWKSLWLKVPTFASKVNRATREAITVSHNPLFALLLDAQAAKRMPNGCTTPSGCQQHGCHGECLPAPPKRPAEPVQEPEELKDPAEYDDFAAAIRHNERVTTRRYDSVGPVALETVYETIIHWDEGGGGKRSRRELARRIVDLYTAPPQRKPLTEEDIVEILCKHFECVDDEYIKRAAQEIAAHNIKENT